MIQRIQTLYLLVVTAMMACTLFLPIAYFNVAGDMTYTLTAFSMNGITGPIWLMGVLLAVATLLPFVTIFLFKNRKMQIGFCAAEFVLQLGALLVFALFLWVLMPQAVMDDGYELVSKNFGWAAVLPIASMPLTYLAGRAIFKDEVLVKSLDRIR